MSPPHTQTQFSSKKHIPPPGAYTVLTYKQSCQISNGQVKKIDIGWSPHVLIADDDHAGGEVTKHSNDEEDAVDDGEEEDILKANMRITKHLFNEKGYVITEFLVKVLRNVFRYYLFDNW